MIKKIRLFAASTELAVSIVHWKVWMSSHLRSVWISMLYDVIYCNRLHLYPRPVLSWLMAGSGQNIPLHSPSLKKTATQLLAGRQRRNENEENECWEAGPLTPTTANGGPGPASSWLRRGHGRSSSPAWSYGLTSSFPEATWWTSWRWVRAWTCATVLLELSQTGNQSSRHAKISSLTTRKKI